MGRVQLNVWVEEEQRDAIKAAAASRGVPVGRLVVEAVLGAAESPSEAAESQMAEAVRRADFALERAGAAENALESLDRRLGRLEEMAGL